MRKQKFFRLLSSGLIILAICLSLAPAAVSQGEAPALRMVIIDAPSAAAVQKLANLGVDIAAVRESGVAIGERELETQAYRVEAVVSPEEEIKLIAAGFSLSDIPGQPAFRSLAEPSYNVYRSFDEPGTGIKDQLYKISRAYKKIARVKTYGYSLQNRPLLVMRLTNDKAGRNKPRVLIIATHHAREWIATEVAMRLIRYLTSNYGTDPRVTNLLNSVEVWIVPVANPDGYQYTFTTQRLWRKNLRDNDGDGQITNADGVDLNRNFDAHWGYEDEGSSPSASNDTYRGSAPNSEPETKAMVKLIRNNKFRFALSYHSYSDLILYPWGWQVRTPSYDDPIFVAQAGTDDNPAIWDSLLGVGYDPGVGADLYTTNGEFTDWAYDVAGVPAQTVELTSGTDASGNFYGFEFPDDEDMIQTVFMDNLPFALAYAESARNPAHPVSPVGITTEDMYHTPVAASYGTDQIIEVLARKGLPLTLTYSINGSPDQNAGFIAEVGERYNTKPGLYYTKYQAVIPGLQAGDVVTYQISGGSSNLGPYTYNVVSATGNPILLVSAEDYTGTNPTYPPGGPFYLSYYTAALDAGGYSYDVWDVDQQGIPYYVEALSHYDAVIWYTGDDYAARVPNGLGTQEEETLNFRDFLNYADGKLFATGQDLSWLATAAGFYPNDFFQYYQGAYLTIDAAGVDPGTGAAFDVQGQAGDPIFDGLSFSLSNAGGGDGADNQFYNDTFLATGYFLPHFDTSISARYVRPGGPFDPHSGAYYFYSQISDSSYKRLGGTFSLPAGSPSLKFWISADTELDWDYVFVEINEVGTDTWTTLPDLNGLTTTGTGQSCPAGWVDQIHTFLAHYMDAACNPTGTTGAWNALTGNSGGWQQVEMDLSAYAGKNVEIFITYASDWATQGLGAFVDDIELSGYPLEDFESGPGMWAASTAPGSTASNNWVWVTGAGIPEGPAVRTPDTVYLGFGFEAIDTAANRNAVMDRVLQYLGQ
jgi:hypothetical protein